MEIKFTETQERRQDLDARLDYAMRTPADSKITVIQNDGKVCLATSTLVVGKATRDPNANRYYRWITTESMGLRRNAAGNVVGWRCRRSWDHRKGNQWVHKTVKPAFDLLSERSEAGEAFQQACWAEFGHTSLSGFFPIAGEYGFDNYSLIPGNILAPFREKNFGDFTRATFGVKRTNDRLITAVANTEPYVVALAHQFRGLVPDKVLTKYIENTQFDEDLMEHFEPHTPRIRDILLAMKPSQVRHLLRDELDLAATRVVKWLSPGKRAVPKRSVDHWARSNVQTWAEFGANQYNW